MILNEIKIKIFKPIKTEIFQLKQFFLIFDETFYTTQANSRKNCDHFVSCISDNTPTCGCVYCNKHDPIIVQALLGEATTLPHTTMVVTAPPPPQQQVVKMAASLIDMQVYSPTKAPKQQTGELYIPSEMPTTAHRIPKINSRTIVSTKFKYNPIPLKDLQDVEMQETVKCELDELYKSAQSIESEIALPGENSNIPDLEEQLPNVTLQITAKGNCIVSFINMSLTKILKNSEKQLKNSRG